MYAYSHLLYYSFWISAKLLMCIFHLRFNGSKGALQYIIYEHENNLQNASPVIVSYHQSGGYLLLFYVLTITIEIILKCHDTIKTYKISVGNTHVYLYLFL